MDDDLFLFTEEVEVDNSSSELWNVLIVDDEPAIHTITSAALKNKVFDGKKLNLISAMSAKEARKILQKKDDISLALIDVVMETPEAGLDLVNYIRNELNNNIIRLVLRTGQPSQAPEESIINMYDINDYKEKTELTSQKLFTLIRTSLKQYKLIQELQLKVKEVSGDLNAQKFALDEHAIVSVTDTKGIITYANERFCKISGYSQEELLGENHRIIKSNEHSDLFWKYMFDEISKGKVFKSEICNKAKDGSLYWVDTTIVPFKDADGKIKSYVSIRSDITEQKKDRDEMLQAKQIAENAVLEKSEFFASMSHEIRTPMNGVLGMLGLIKRSKLNEVQAHQVLIAQNSATSLLSIVNDILDFSKIEAGKMELESIEYNLRAELGDIAESLALKAEENGVEIILDLSKIIYTTIKSDSVRLRQIVNNIVGNSIKFTHNGNIIITASCKTDESGDTFLSLDISDTGIGIPQDKVDTLFDSFSQVDSSTTRKYGGTGLGLTITKDLCELMGGSINVTSELGVGTTFHINLKIEYSDKKELVLPDEIVKNKKILIVDNNKPSSQKLKAQLELWGMQVSESSSARAAVELCEKSSDTFDMAFVDMNMREMNGIELSFELRQNIKYSKMKLILMTRLDSKISLDHFQKIGINAFIPKPLTTDDLFHAFTAFMHKDNELVSRTFIDNEAIDSSQLKWPKNTKILLVDDNKTNQLVAEGILETFNLEIDTTSNGLEALKVLKNAPMDEPYTLVLMDCMMPLMDGYEATMEIRKGNAGYNNVEIPIIAMTANVGQSDKDKCILSGMNDYLPKPINPKQFLETLKKWIK